MKPETPETLDLLAELALDALDPVEPAADVRARLMKTLDGPERFAPFFATLGRVCDLPLEAVKKVLARIDDAAAWVDGLPGVKVFDFAAGPALGAVDAGMVRLVPGGSFPRHRHLGEEVTVVLEGTLLDGGVSYGPGATITHPTDSIHDYAAAPGRDLVLMILNRGIAPVL